MRTDRGGDIEQSRSTKCRCGQRRQFGVRHGRGIEGAAKDDDRAPGRQFEHGLLTTGSSDYHGTNKTTPLAEETTDPEVYAALTERATGVPVLHGGSGGTA